MRNANDLTINKYEKIYANIKIFVAFQKNEILNLNFK